MQINKLKKLRDNRYELSLTNQEKIVLYDDLIIKYNLLSKKDFTKKELDDLIKENNSLEVYYVAIKYIKIKLRSEKEIIKYLENKKYLKKDIDKTIKKLKDEKLINSKLYLTAYINDQINLTNNGYYKILSSLEKLGFSKDEVLIYLNEIDEDIWYNKVTKLIAKKIRINNKYSTKKLKEKILYDLINLGYKKDIILELLDNENIEDSSFLEKEYNKQKKKLERKYEGKELEYQIKIKLLAKGFSYNDIDKIIN